MIDCLKIHSLPVLPEKLLKNDLLTFPQSNVSTEGEALNRWQPAYFQTLTFKVKGNNSRLSGSLHKYRYEGENWQDFNLLDIQEVIHEISETFEFDPKKTVLNFIEIGVNIPLDYDPTPFINCFVLYRNIPFEKMKVTGKGFGKEVITDDFTIKVYNKSLQYGLPHHLLRFEIKVKAIKLLKRYEINGLTLADLTGPDIYPKFKTMLLDMLESILIYNPNIDPEKITNLNDRELLKLGKYADYWQQMDRRRKSEKLMRFKELAGTNEVLKTLKNKISEKWEMLSNPDKLHTFRKEETKQGNHQPGQITPTIKGEYVRTCKVTGLPIQDQQSKSKYCPITKEDISMQKGNSHLLSNTGLKMLVQNDYCRYEEIRRRILPRRGVSGLHTKFEEDEINHLSHQIRNVFYNNQKEKIDLKINFELRFSKC